MFIFVVCQLNAIFFSEIQENCHQIESPPKKETDIVSFAEAGLWNKFYPSRDFWPGITVFKDIAFNTEREHWCKYHKIK